MDILAVAKGLRATRRASALNEHVGDTAGRSRRRIRTGNGRLCRQTKSGYTAGTRLDALVGISVNRIVRRHQHALNVSSNCMIRTAHTHQRDPVDDSWLSSLN